MNLIYIYILFGGQGLRTLVILVLCECIWNAPAFSLVLPVFDDTGSWVFLCVGWSIPLLPWITDSHFLPGNRVAELKLTTFSSVLHSVSPLLLSPSRIVLPSVFTLSL